MLRPGLMDLRRFWTACQNICHDVKPSKVASQVGRKWKLMEDMLSAPLHACAF